MWRWCWYAIRGSVKYKIIKLKCFKCGDMFTVCKINEVAKEFGFILKEKQKNCKIVCLFFDESSLYTYRV